MKTLEMLFLTTEAKTVKVSIENPLETLTGTQIGVAMDAIITNNVFDFKGAAIASKKGARIVERDVTDVALA